MFERFNHLLTNIYNFKQPFLISNNLQISRSSRLRRSSRDSFERKRELRSSKFDVQNDRDLHHANLFN